MQLQQVEGEIAALNDKAEACDREARRAKKEAHAVEQRLKTITADLHGKICYYER